MQQTRRFLDSFGFHWQVVEIEDPSAETDPASESENTPRGWLYFIARGWTRVIRDYPAEWGRLGWAELEDLCASAAPVGGDAFEHPPWHLHRTAAALGVER